MSIKITTKNLNIPNYNRLSVYREHGGYEALKKALSMEPAAVTDEVKRSNLVGLGGAGFPAGVKWGFIPKDTPKAKYLVVNGDEGEPGTFKDRYLLEFAPHQLIEGMIICSYAVGIHKAYIYIRGEYIRQIKIVRRAVEEAQEAGLLGENILGSGFNLDIVVHQGAGAYICGEETGLIESLEGKKGFPRIKPPFFPAAIGLFGCPTVINNVETLSQVPHVIANGAEWFASIGTEKNGGTRVFAVSGHVRKPGICELPMGVPLRELIYEHCGGMRDDRPVKAVIPGGSSSPVLTADHLDTKMDFVGLRDAGSMGGSGAVVVMDDTTCMVDVCANIARFYAHESCGQCTPCREGTGWVSKILDRILAGNARPEDVDNAVRVAKNMMGRTICLLADGAAMPILSYLTKFRNEFDYHVEHKCCDVKGG
ncbi:MAG: NADH-quinone oxidoreductase subunit NuoF [Armatimonadetes bacterium]|nr:NADH-quinone oxidoreductase subunit NuoF [Armatimonadota bacterium]